MAHLCYCHCCSILWNHNGLGAYWVSGRWPLSTAECWNDLPEYIRMTKDIKQFKSLLKGLEFLFQTLLIYHIYYRYQLSWSFNICLLWNLIPACCCLWGWSFFFCKVSHAFLLLCLSTMCLFGLSLVAKETLACTTFHIFASCHAFQGFWLFDLIMAMVQATEVSLKHLARKSWFSIPNKYIWPKNICCFTGVLI